MTPPRNLATAPFEAVQSSLFRRDRRQAALREEALHALALHLGGVDVAVLVDGDVVQILELAGTTPDAPEIADDRSIAFAQNMDLTVRIVRGEPIALVLVRPEHGRARHTRRGGIAQHRNFADKLAVLFEHL